MNRYICTTCDRWCYSSADPDTVINGRCPQPDCAGYTVPDPEVAAGSHTADTRLAEIERLFAKIERMLAEGAQKEAE